MAVKVSEGTDASFMQAGSADWIRRGKAAGLQVLSYHYLRAGDEDAQAKLFGQQLRTAEVPGMLDAEDGAGNIGNIRAFIEACRKYGAPVPLMYLPRWYWQKIGSPSLTGLPPLWASRYVSGDTGPPQSMYTRHNPAGWTSYGGQSVEVLQFTDKAWVAGRNIDANHYRGTRDQFAALIGGARGTATLTTTAQEDDMAQVSQEAWNNLVALVQHIADQMDGPGAGMTRWSSRRINETTPSKFTLTEIAWEIDRELNSPVPVPAQPAEGTSNVRLLQHVLSLRAEVRDLKAQVEALTPKDQG